MLSVLLCVIALSLEAPLINGQFFGFQQQQLQRGRGQQSNRFTSTEANCTSFDMDGQKLEVIIRPVAATNPFLSFYQPPSNYEIVVVLDTTNKDNKVMTANFTVVITELSADNEKCTEGRLGPILDNSQRSFRNRGLLSLLQGVQPQTSAGIVGSFRVVASKKNTITFTANRLFNNFREFRGFSLAICKSVNNPTPATGTPSSLSFFYPQFQPQMTAAPTCAMPIACCKLGLARP